jgi:hypothetical protein
MRPGNDIRPNPRTRGAFYSFYPFITSFAAVSSKQLRYCPKYSLEPQSIDYHDLIHVGLGGISVNELRDAIKMFIRERDWEQFHSPKNLAMALSVEVAEIVEHFQWLNEEQSRNLSPAFLWLVLYLR